MVRSDARERLPILQERAHLTPDDTQLSAAVSRSAHHPMAKSCNVAEAQANPSDNRSPGP